jgi:hypothetical protein
MRLPVVVEPVEAQSRPSQEVSKDLRKRTVAP